ncbi:MAG: GntR family transcriptional regulator [Candidatus Leucobacter sulfamidivorax]|nr:GntR family transcriptional regulator [Candidatus Leucobacter sulfamidivorax]
MAKPLTRVPSDHQSAPDVAYEWIKRYIVDLPRDQDAFLNEVALATATETSRTPVREALLRLESEGFLRRIPRKGVYVPQITDADVRALLDARALVEQWAVHSAGEAIRRDAETFQDLIDQQRQSQDDTARFIELDIEFHARMVSLGSNPVLNDFYRSLRQRQLRIGVRAVTHGPNRAENVLREHQAILDAVCDDGDVDEAIRLHLQSTLAAATAA